MISSFVPVHQFKKAFGYPSHQFAIESQKNNIRVGRCCNVILLTFKLILPAWIAMGQENTAIFVSYFESFEHKNFYQNFKVQ